MNWLGTLVQKEISVNETVLDLGCGIMQSTLDTSPSYPPTKLQCKFIVGVDIYRKYLSCIKHRQNISVLTADVSKPLPFPDKSFDVVLLLDILEHLERDKAEQLVFEAERIARKKVVIYTPKVFYDNVEHKLEHFPYCSLGDNPYQEHKCYFSPKWFEQHHYTVTFPTPDFNTFAIRCFVKEKTGLHNLTYKQLKYYFKSQDTWCERLIIEKFSTPLAYVILKLNQSRKLPYALTMTSFSFFFFGAILIYFGFYAIGSIVCFFGMIADHCDGVTARFIYGKDPSLRGFLDLTMDSFSASVILLALLYVFWVNEMFSGLFLLFSYTISLLIFWIQCSTSYRLSLECKKNHRISHLPRKNAEKPRFLKFLVKLYVKINHFAKKHRSLPHPTACDSAFLVYIMLPLSGFELHIPILILGILFVLLDIFKMFTTNYYVIKNRV